MVKPSTWPTRLYIDHIWRKANEEHGSKLEELAGTVKKGSTKYVKSVLKALQWKELRFTCIDMEEDADIGIAIWLENKNDPQLQFSSLQKGWIKSLGLTESTQRKKALKLTINYQQLLSENLKKKLAENKE
eukprot:361241_1